jgi:hypothetical protein
MAEIINLPPIHLEWSEWVPWNHLKLDARSGGRTLVPNGRSGVYEVKYADAEQCLTIGKASDLRMRVKQGRVKGKIPHSAGAKIRESEDTSQLIVRWAVTDRPAAVEEELHMRYKARFGRLPTHCCHT